MSLNNVTAWALWLLAASAWVAAIVTRDPVVGQAGCVTSAAAATVHVRGFLCTFHTRERRVFELGRELGRQEAAEAQLPLQRVR